jgi:hypothetical protein
LHIFCFIRSIAIYSKNKKIEYTDNPTILYSLFILSGHIIPLAQPTSRHACRQPPQAFAAPEREVRRRDSTRLAFRVYVLEHQRLRTRHASIACGRRHDWSSSGEEIAARRPVIYQTIEPTIPE